MLPNVSVVVLSYDRPALLGEALDSVSAQTYGALDVIAVDNPSPSSAEVARLVGARPGVRLVANRSNEGYAGGMNRGIEQAAGTYVLLTEDDIVLAPDCVARLVEYAEAHPEVGLCAPVIYNRGARTIRCAGTDLHLGGVFRKRVIGAGEEDRGQFPEPFEPPYLDGAVLFARAEVLRRAGGFREYFFMYAEASDLCARVVKAGWRLAVVPAARAEHFEPPPAAGPDPLAFHRHKNFFALYLLHAPARVLPEFVARYVLLGGLRALAGRGAPRGEFFRAVWWAARRAPALVGERRGHGRPGRGEGEGRAAGGALAAEADRG